jgi:prophage regulatory protein
MIALTSMSADFAPKTILRCPEVLGRTGLSYTMLYDKIKKGEFSRQVPLGVRAVGWYEDEVDDWIAKREELRRRDCSALQVWDETELTSAEPQKTRPCKAPVLKKLKTPTPRNGTTPKAPVVQKAPVLKRLELIKGKVCFDRDTEMFWIEARSKSA